MIRTHVPNCSTDWPPGELTGTDVQSGSVTTATRPAAPPRPQRWHARPVLVWWTALLAAALAGWWLTGSAGTASSGGAAAEEFLSYAALPPILVVAVLVATARGWSESVRWRPLLLLGYLATSVWTLTLAATGGALWTTVIPDEETTPPLPGLLLDRLAGSGVDGSAATVLVCLAGAAATPLVALAIRSLCDESAARRLLPMLTLAPYAVVGANAEAIALGLGAATLAVAAVASEAGRAAPVRLAVAVACGVLLGCAALFGFAAVLLAAGVVCVFFVRRRPLLNVATAAGFFLPIVLARTAGYDWTEDLGKALRDADPSHGYAGGLFAAAVMLLVLCGPALVASVRSMRTTPAWPFLVAGGASAVAAMLAGLITDRVSPGSLLPALPWLLVAASAPAAQSGQSRPVPPGVVAVAAAAAYALAVLARLT